jgi:hypothetical protein
VIFGKQKLYHWEVAFSGQQSALSPDYGLENATENFEIHGSSRAFIF